MEYITIALIESLIANHINNIYRYSNTQVTHTTKKLKSKILSIEQILLIVNSVKCVYSMQKKIIIDGISWLQARACVARYCLGPAHGHGIDVRRCYCQRAGCQDDPPNASAAGGAALVSAGA